MLTYKIANSQQKPIGLPDRGREVLTTVGGEPELETEIVDPALERTSLDDDSLGRAALNQVLELSRRGVEGLKLGRLGAGLIQTGDRLEFSEI